MKHIKRVYRCPLPRGNFTQFIRVPEELPSEISDAYLDSVYELKCPVTGQSFTKEDMISQTERIEVCVNRTVSS